MKYKALLSLEGLQFEPQYYSECTLDQILQERNRRVLERERLADQFGESILCVALNVAGPIKRSYLFDLFFYYAQSYLLQILEKQGVSILMQSKLSSVAGLYLILNCSLPEGKNTTFLKKVAMDIEENSPAMRLLDLDVFSDDGVKLSRADSSNMTIRRCLLCDNEAFVCARSRAHPLPDLIAVTKGLIIKELLSAYQSGLERAAYQAMLDEVRLTPKPGLVDSSNNGSHQDMSIASFERSAQALKPYLQDYVSCGYRFREWLSINNERQVSNLSVLFKELNRIGRVAEEKSLAVNGGVNCHMGLNYAFALLLGAAGYLFRDKLAQLEINSCIMSWKLPTVQEICFCSSDIVKNDYMKWRKSVGEEMPGGARETAFNGYYHVRTTCLHVIIECLRNGLSFRDSALYSLLYLMAENEDSNILRRADSDTLNYVKKKSLHIVKRNSLNFLDKRLLSTTNFDTESFHQDLLAFDRELIDMNVSPGGSADLLALGIFFVYLWQDYRHMIELHK